MNPRPPAISQKPKKQPIQDESLSTILKDIRASLNALNAASPSNQFNTPGFSTLPTFSASLINQPLSSVPLFVTYARAYISGGTGPAYVGGSSNGNTLGFPLTATTASIPANDIELHNVDLSLIFIFCGQAGTIISFYYEQPSSVPSIIAPSAPNVPSPPFSGPVISTNQTTQTSTQTSTQIGTISKSKFPGPAQGRTS